MKLLLFLVGFMGSVFFTLSDTSRAAPFGGFHGRFVVNNGSPAFRMGRGIRRDFPFHQRGRFSQRDRRFVFGQVGWPLYWYPYDDSDYYPLDSSYLDYGSDYGYAESSVPVQSDYSRRASAPSPIVVVINQGSSRSSDSSNTDYASRSYGSTAAEGQQRIVTQKSNEQTAVRAEPLTLVAPAAAKDDPAPVQATQATPQAKAGAVDKLVLVSWLEEGGKDVIYVQNTRTNEVQRITSEPNIDHFRIVEIRPNSDPRQFEAVISNGNEQVPVRFRF